MALALKNAWPLPLSLYTAVKVWVPGVRPVSSTVTLAPTGLSPVTRSEFMFKAVPSSTLTDMNPVSPFLPPLASAVRIHEHDSRGPDDRANRWPSEQRGVDRRLLQNLRGGNGFDSSGYPVRAGSTRTTATVRCWSSSPMAGLRISEALGLRWCDVDFDAALLHVRQQLTRYRKLKHLKTDAGRRDVVLAPAVVRLLRERWLASPYKTADHLIFYKVNGEPGDYRDAGEAFRAAVKAAGLHGEGRLSLHSLRHAFASLLIAKGLNVVFVSRQLGHSSPRITLDVYAHLFEQADHAVAAREGPRGELCGDDRNGPVTARTRGSASSRGNGPSRGNAVVTASPSDTYLGHARPPHHPRHQRPPVPTLRRRPYRQRRPRNKLRGLRGRRGGLTSSVTPHSTPAI